MSDHKLPFSPVTSTLGTYHDGDRLPEGWAIVSTFTPGVVGQQQPSWAYEALRDGVPQYFAESLLDVEEYIEKASATTTQQVTSPPKDVRPYGDAEFRTDSDGVPLPIGWVIRYHADKQEYVAYYNNVRKGRFYTRTQATEGVLAEDAERRIVLQAHAKADTARIDQIIEEAEKALGSANASAAAAKTALTALPEKAPRPSNRLLALGVLAGALVGGLLTGAVFAAQAPEQVVQEVTPVSCWQALTHADDLIGTYGSGLQASMETLAPRARGLKTFSEDAARLTPLYDASRAECLAFKQ